MRSEFERRFWEQQRRIYERFRDQKIEEARREGVSTLVLPLPNGGEERIDLREH